MHLHIGRGYKSPISPRMIRTIWPVGHGLFCSEKFLDSFDEVTALVVYDCGSKHGIQWDILEEKFKPKERNIIDLLFISHFHADHINGISYLLGNYHIRKILLPVITTSILAESYIYNTLYSTEAASANSLLIGFAKRSIDSSLSFVRGTEDFGPVVSGDNVTDSSSIGDSVNSGIIIGIDGWIYIPFNNVDSDELRKFENKLSSLYPRLHNMFANIDKFSEYDIQEQIKEIGIPRLKELYENFGNMNRTSMTVYSAPMGIRSKTKAACLYTGDYPMREKDYPYKIMSYYLNYWHTIGTLQVPHHGSDPDNPEELYERLKDTTSIISADKGDPKHPGRQTLINLANSRSSIYIVTEEQETKFIHTIIR